MRQTEHDRRLRVLTLITGGLAAVALASAALGSCIGGAAQPTSTPTYTSVPPSPSPPPTATPSPSPTPVLTPTSTSRPEDVNPLTGEVVDDPNVLDRVPVAIKISNWPGRYVRPQAGINSADLIYEHYNEGWFATRWTALYLGEEPERVGPIRSGRLIDLEIPPMYEAVLACSGFSDGVRAKVRKSDIYPDWVVSDSLPETIEPRPFYREQSRDVPLEHTMYTSPALVREWAAKRGIEGRRQLEGMVFSDEVTVQGAPASTIEIPWNRLDAEWRYDEASGRYLRWTDGTAHADALDGQQLSVANVVVLYVPQWNTDIVEDPHSGALSIQFALWKSNRAILFRDGMRIDAFWQRWKRDDMLTLTDDEGNPIPLKVGSSFFEVVPTGDRVIEIVVD